VCRLDKGEIKADFVGSTQEGRINHSKANLASSAQKKPAVKKTAGSSGKEFLAAY
jgi:hypothetical protein